MQSAKKIILIPSDPNIEQIGGAMEDLGKTGTLVSEVEPKKDKIKAKIYDKIHRILKIIMKLAKTTGYDDELRIKLKNGKFLEKSNVVDLITHAMSTGKILYGESEFIELLHMSNVEPSLIINENVRSKLIHFQNQTNKKNHEEIDISDENLELKRKIETVDESEESEPLQKKIKTNFDNIEHKKQERIKPINNKNKRKFEDLGEIEDDQINPEDWDIPKD